MTRFFRILMACSLLILPLKVWAGVEVDINQGNHEPTPIAIPNFSVTVIGAQGQVSGAALARVIATDLEQSGRFRALESQTTSEQKPDDINTAPDFIGWKNLKAQYLIQGHIRQDADDRLRVDVRLWSVFRENQLLGVQFTATPDNWRRIAHKIADAAYKQLTGMDGYFDTRIVFVAENRFRDLKSSRLAIMDQDGANPSYLSNGDFLPLLPRFANTAADEILYTAMRPDSTRIYLFNITTGRHEVLVKARGMVFAPCLSSDGATLVFSLENNGSINLFSKDLKVGVEKKLTDDPGINTSPSFSPDGRQIAFISDRSGSPQIYVMDKDGGHQRRISFGGGRYTTPVWSPLGDSLAFTRQDRDQFHIGLMKPNGSDERLLTTSYLDEGPNFAPNGQVLIFSRQNQGEKPRLWKIDIDGRNERPVPYMGIATDPSWSSILP